MLDTATQANPATANAFAALLSALRADALAPGADFERIASYCRSVERQAQRYAQGLPLTEPRTVKGG